MKKAFLFVFIFLLTFLAYLPLKIPALGNLGDNMWYIPQTISLISEGDLNIDEYSERIKEVKGYAVVDTNGHKFNFFPYGTSLINYPVTFLTKIFFDCDFSAEKDRVYCSFKIAELNAKIFASLSVSLIFFIVLVLTSSYVTSFVLTFVFAFASPHLSNHAGGLWSHNISVFLITFTLLLMVLKSRYSFVSSFALGLAYITRPTMSLSVIGLSFYFFLSRNMPDFIKFSFLGLLVFIAFLLFNSSIFGSYLPPYYSANRLSLNTFGEAYLGQLISPNRGLIVFFPMVVFSLIGGFLAFKNKCDILYRILFIMVIGYSLLYAAFPHWWMGWSYGPRIYAELLPYLIVLMIPAIDLIKKYIIVRWIGLIFLAWSLFVQIAGVATNKPILWNAEPVNVDLYPNKIWSWQDMQILRNFTSPKNYVDLTLYKSKIELLDLTPVTLGKGEDREIELLLTNLGDEKWRSLAGGETSKPVNISYHVINSNGDMYLWDGVRTSLPIDVISRQTIPIRMKFVAPINPGYYTVEIELVHEPVRWFGDIDMHNKLIVPVVIE